MFRKPEHKEKLDEYGFFKEIALLADELETEIYVVGGFVRDLLLERDRKDLDFMVVGDGPAFAKKLSKKLGIEAVTIFKRFGTAYFNYKGYDLEFVGARKESYSKDSRKPTVTKGSFDDDIKRRDFTINTLAIALNSKEYGRLIDKFGGYADLKSKLIKTPLDPVITFDDDPLRILRAIRFAAQLSFDIDEKVLEAAHQMRERLRIVSMDRIKDEFEKILKADKPSIGLDLLYKTGVLDVFFPELAKLGGVDQRKEFHHKDVFYHTLQVVDKLSEETDNVWLRFAGLVHDIAKPPTKKFVDDIGWTFHGHDEIGSRMIKGIFKRLRLPFAKLEYVAKLVRLHLRPIALAKEDVTDSAIRRLIVEAGEDLEDLITLCRADITSKNEYKVQTYLQNYDRVMARVREVKEKDELRAFQSPVRGDEIMKITGLPQGKMVGDIKRAIEDAILDGKIRNTYEDAYEYMIKIKDQYL